MACLLTGGAGFIGSNFVRDWFETGGGPLVNLDKLTYAGNPRNLEGLASGARTDPFCSTTSATASAAWSSGSVRSSAAPSISCMATFAMAQSSAR